MKVVKFGGSSLANGEAFQNAINIITSDPQRRVIVTSAPGKRFADDIKVTDLLIKYAQAVIAGQNPQEIVEQILNRYQEIAAYFGLPADKLIPLVERLEGLPNHTYPNDNYLLAAFKAHGERLNAQLMAILLQHLGYEARFVTPSEAGIIVTGTPNNANVIPETYANLSHFTFNENELLVFPGFYGLTLAGHIATFSRGGSDITGAIEYIHKQLLKERDAGKAILLVSYELSEIMQLSDRILVLHHGQKSGIVQPEQTTKTELGLLMTGVKKEGKDLDQSFS